MTNDNEARAAVQVSQPSNNDARLISRTEFARMLGKSTRVFDRLKSAGRLPDPVGLEGHRQWVKSKIEQWIEQGCPPPRRSRDK